jgi:Na+/H+-dicarboxylate symporter
MSEKKKMSLLMKIALGFVFGMIFGFIVGPYVPDSVLLKEWVMPTMDILGKIFLSCLKMLIVPLVFCSLASGAANIGDTTKLGRVGAKTMFLYIVTTPIAIFWGLLLANTIQPGLGMNIEGVTMTAPPSKPMVEVLLNIIPTNPIDSFVKADMLQIITFALFFGVAAIYAGEKGKRAASALDSIAEVMYSMTAIIMKFAPYGVFGLISVTAARFGIKILVPYAKIILCVYAGCIIHAGLVYSNIIYFYCKRSPLWFFKSIQNCLLTAFVTRSSSATLPITIKDVRDNLGVSDSLCSFMLPLGATINMDGAALYQGLCAVFVAQAFGIDMTIQMQLIIVLTATLGSIGAAGVPGASLIMLTMVLTSVGLPLEGIALVAGIDVVLDSARTCLNVMGDPTMACVVATSEGETIKGNPM